jgi:Uma2 family endonuclease
MKTDIQRVAAGRAASTDETDLPLVLRLKPVLNLSDDQLLALCEINHELWIERNARGELLLMPPVGSETGQEEGEITRQLGNWAKRDDSGVAFGPSAGFRLPNTAVRAADAAWIRHTRWEAVPPEERKKFAPLCPDFVIELRSPSDRLRDLQDKMEEWIANGAQLGWLLDPEPRHVYIYRPDQPAERLEDPDRLSGDPLLPGFVLDLREVW